MSKYTSGDIVMLKKGTLKKYPARDAIEIHPCLILFNLGDTLIFCPITSQFSKREELRYQNATITNWKEAHLHKKSWAKTDQIGSITDDNML